MNRYYLYICFCLLFLQCNSSKKEKEGTKLYYNNITLTPFTEELISQFIEDIWWGDCDVFISVVANSDSLYYDLTLCLDNLHYVEENHYLEDNPYACNGLLGQTTFQEYRLLFFGEPNNLFFKCENPKEIKCKEYDAPLPYEYDPPIWYFTLHKDTTFCKMRTRKEQVYDDDISSIEQLSSKYFRTSETIHNEIFEASEINTPPYFILGNDSLHKIIQDNFDAPTGKRVIVDLLIDKQGNVYDYKILRSSGDTDVDKEALRVVEIISNYSFSAPMHGNERVNSRFTIPIRKYK